MNAFRTYHEVAGTDRSDLGGQVGRQRERVTARLAQVGHVIPVMSGKGGVGKSYVTGILARGLRARRHRVGVLDADLRSPTIAKTLGAAGPLHVGEEGVTPATGHGGIKVMSTDLLLDEGRPLEWVEPDGEQFVWRGILETGALREFLSDVVWGELDFLLVDLPPGADGVADLKALVPDLAGAVVVTIPSDESYRSVFRTMASARDHGIKLLGVTENMNGYVCGECSTPGPLFHGDAGARLSEAFGVPVLASLPFSTDNQAEPPLLLDRFLEAVG